MVAKRSSLAAVLLAVPGSALALGLGNIHVQSHLDQPLDARISLVDPTPGALQSLSVGVASSATFARYGLNRPAYLDDAHVKIVHASDGGVVVHVTSDKPVTDPILTLLIKASWDRGVMIREYTLLLNPPVYMPRHAQAPQAIAAPVTGPGHREGAIHHSAPAAAAQAPAPQAPATPAAAASAPHSISVHRGDTLSGIASRVSGAGLNAARTHQWMVAIYRANPQAFERNMNLLRSGSVLSIPARSSARQISPSAAWGEIRHQTEAWRSTLEAQGGASGRLRLVAPPGTGTGSQTGRGNAPAAGEVRALKSQVQTLQGELAREKRLLQVKSAALAQLQAQTGHTPAAAPAKPAAASAGHPASAASAASATKAAKATQAAQPGSSSPAVAASKPAAHKPVKATAAHAQPVAQPSLVGTVLGVLKSYWWAVAGLVVLLAGLFGLQLSRARRVPAGDDLLGEAAAEGIGDSPAPAPVPEPVHPDDGFDVGESSLEHPTFAAEEGVAPLVAKHVTTDETISSETALNLEQGDPLAEADFHMAYGLYDQAADLIRLAIAREPERRDLKLKLLEVFFVWGNKEQFVHTAHELAESRADAAPGEWEKVVIMGRQLAPDDPLFADAGVSGAASGGVDLDLEGGQGRVDFDPIGTAAPLAAAGGTGTAGGLDLDFGAALGGADVGEQTDNHFDTGTVTDVNAALAEPDSTMSDTGLTREMPDQPEVTVETPMNAEPTVETPMGAEPTVETPMGAEPTVEQPALPLAEHAALRQKVEALSQGSDRTAELAIDDLGLDLGTFETAVQSGVESDAPTLVAGLDEQSREALAMADATPQGGSEPEPEPTGTTSAWKIDENELESLLAGDSSNGHDAGATSRLSALEAPDVDFDVGGEEPAKAGGNGLDFDVGTVTVPHADLAEQSEIAVDPGMAEIDPVTPSEVGTKLDLARAYMDMGDPEGARSILQEVVHEGSDVQRQEAGRLLESLPG